MTDVELLNRMLDAATSHASRIGRENHCRLADGKNIVVGSVEKIASLAVDVSQVRTRIEELLC